MVVAFVALFSDPLLVSWLQVNVNEVILKVYFQLVLVELLILFKLLVLEWQFKLYFHHFLDGSYRDGH